MKLEDIQRARLWGRTHSGKKVRNVSAALEQRTLPKLTRMLSYSSGTVSLQGRQACSGWHGAGS